MTPAKATIEMPPQKGLGWHDGHCLYWNVESSHNSITSYTLINKIKVNPWIWSNLLSVPLGPLLERFF